MRAIEALYQRLTGTPSLPPHWAESVSGQGALAYAQTCALRSETASQRQRPRRAIRFALSATLWRLRANYLEEHGCPAWEHWHGPHYRSGMARRSQSAAYARFTAAERRQAVPDAD